MLILLSAYSEEVVGCLHIRRVLLKVTLQTVQLVHIVKCQFGIHIECSSAEIVSVDVAQESASAPKEHPIGRVPQLPISLQRLESHPLHACRLRIQGADLLTIIKATRKHTWYEFFFPRVL